MMTNTTTMNSTNSVRMRNFSMDTKEGRRIPSFKMETKEEIQLQIDIIERTAESVGFTPYLSKRRDSLYKKLNKLK